MDCLVADIRYRNIGLRAGVADDLGRELQAGRRNCSVGDAATPLPVRFAVIVLVVLVGESHREAHAAGPGSGRRRRKCEIHLAVAGVRPLRSFRCIRRSRLQPQTRRTRPVVVTPTVALTPVSVPTLNGRFP